MTAHGILHTGPQKKDAQVTINAPDAKDRGANGQIDPPPSPSNVSAPIVNASVKDEVELLRQGVMNKVSFLNFAQLIFHRFQHGEHVKPQGLSNNN
jgi:hypothetical protein